MWTQTRRNTIILILVSDFNMLDALRNVSNVVDFKGRETPADALNEILRPSELIIPWSSVRVLPSHHTIFNRSVIYNLFQSTNPHKYCVAHRLYILQMKLH